MENPGYLKSQEEDEKKTKESVTFAMENFILDEKSQKESNINLELEPKPESVSVSEFKAKKFPQLIAAIAACLGGFGYGTIMCYSGVAFPKLRTDSDFGHVTENEISWMSSVITLGALVSCPPSGVVADGIGRRKTMMILTLPFVTGWLLIYFAPSVGFILAGRFLTGFCGGTFNLVSPIFIAETAEPGIRGMLISMFMLMSSIGGLFIFIAGTFLSWRTSALVSAVIPLISLAILWFVPETPRFLLSKGKEENAMKSLCWFRGTTKAEDVKPEFFELLEHIEKSKKEDSGWKMQITELCQIPVLKSLFLIFTIFFFQVFCGIYSVDLYVVDILESAGSSFSPYYSTIIIWVVCCLTSAASMVIVDRFGRKPLMIMSELTMALALATLATFFFIKDHHDHNLPFSSVGRFIPLLSISLLLGGFCFGLGSIPSFYLPELIPQKIRGVSSALLLISKWLMMFIAGQFFKDFMSGLGEMAGYFTLAGICIIGAFYVLLFVPETKGKSIEETSGMTQKSNIKEGKSEIYEKDSSPL